MIARPGLYLDEAPSVACPLSHQVTDQNLLCAPDQALSK